MKWQTSALTSANMKGVSYPIPTSPRRIASKGEGPHWNTPIRYKGEKYYLRIFDVQ